MVADSLAAVAEAAVAVAGKNLIPRYDSGMNNERGNIKIVLAIIIVLIAVFVIFAHKEAEDTLPKPTPSEHVQQPAGGKESAAIVIAGKASVDDLVDLSIIPGQSVSGAVTITGTLQGGYFFEGNVLVNIVDKSKTVLKAGHGTATGDWMTSGPVAFSATVDVTGLPHGFAYIALQNDNPSDDRALDKIIYIPIVINE
jgi:hypothetical protein